MPTIVHKLGEEDQEDWERLHNVYQSVFLFGECHAFALALHQGLEWPMIGLIVNEEIYHTGVRTPDGKIFDVRGPVSETEFGRPYKCTRSCNSVDYLREVEERELYATRPISDRMIQRARSIAEVLWPELPWKDSFVSKVSSFADELEALCRKHKFWIRATVPAAPPPPAIGEGDEGGYRLRPTIDGFTYTIERYLAP